MINNMKIATLWSRVGGAIIDLIVTLSITFVVCVIWKTLIGADDVYGDMPIEQSKELWRGRGALTGIIIDFVYTVLLMTSTRQATLGQRAVGVKTVKDDGSTIGYGAASLRVLVSYFSSVLLKIGYLIAVFTKNKKTLHDLVAGTVVIEEEQLESLQHVSEKNNNEIKQNVDANLTNSTIPLQLRKKSDSMEDAYGRIADLNSNQLQPKTNELSANSSQAQRKSAVNEEMIWEQVYEEFESSERKKGLWAKLYAESEGDEVKAKAKYLQQRASQLIQEAKEDK